MDPTPPADGCEFGFNSDVSYRNQTYHVQTESLAVDDDSTINTLVYLRGALVKKISTSSRDAPATTRPEVLAERIKRQHLDVLGRIKRGEIPDRQPR